MPCLHQRTPGLRAHFRCARSCFPFPVGFCSLNCKQLRKSSQFFCENKTVKQTANNREKKPTIKRQTLLELLLLKILTIKKKNITQKITQHSPMCFLKTIIYDITILYHKHRTPPPYTNNKCNRNKGLLLTKLDKLLSFSYYVLQLSCAVDSGYKCQLFRRIHGYFISYIKKVAYSQKVFHLDRFLKKMSQITILNFSI